MKRRNSGSTSTWASASEWELVAGAWPLANLPTKHRAVLASLLLMLVSGCHEEGQLDAQATVEEPPVQAALADMSLKIYDEGCLATGCHEQLGGQRWVHGPVATNDCAACHEPQGAPADHNFSAVTEGAELCYSCHEPPGLGEYTHDPYAEGRCLDCHDPHGGADKSYITTQSASELCGKCHEPRGTNFLHTPVAQGDCLACHRPHASSNAHLLALDERELCLSCHREYSGLLPENIGGEGLSLANAHQVLVDEGCLICHRAHGSSHAALLDEPSTALCASCHGDILKALPGAKTVHGAFDMEDSCIQCHSPHASTFDHLLRSSPGKLCFQCHDREIALPMGGRIVNVEGQLDAAEHIHLPVAQGECTACHLAHFSSERSLLRLEYPDHIYADFDDEAYGLCFQCHDRALAEQERYTDTGFRDGMRNLHYVHVHREKGRACDICHRPHGSGYPNLLRKSFPFGPGKWDMPIDYVQSEHGGTCTSACHEVQSYDNSAASEHGEQPRSLEK